MNDAVIAELPAATRSSEPLTIRMHEHDNVAIVANDGGLPPGAVLSSGLALHDRVPQGHKVALVDLPADAPVLRYGIPIGYALKDIPAGSWVHERLLRMPAARELDNLPIATVKPTAAGAARGLHVRGLSQSPTARSARATSWRSRPPCNAWPAWWTLRYSASRPSCCRSFRTSTTWSASSTPTAAASRSTRQERRFRFARCATSA